VSFVCNLLRHILQNKRSSGRKRNRTQAGLIVQSNDHANAISGRYEVEQIEAILLLKLITSEGSNLSKEKSLPFSVFIIGCRIVRKTFADFVGAFIYFHFTERIVCDSSLILGFTTGRILLGNDVRLFVSKLQYTLSTSWPRLFRQNAQHRLLKAVSKLILLKPPTNRPSDILQSFLLSELPNEFDVEEAPCINVSEE
jgi:hypothetical protein